MDEDEVRMKNLRITERESELIWKRSYFDYMLPNMQ